MRGVLALDRTMCKPPSVAQWGCVCQSLHTTMTPSIWYRHCKDLPCSGMAFHNNMSKTSPFGKTKAVRVFGLWCLPFDAQKWQPACDMGGERPAVMGGCVWCDAGRKKQRDGGRMLWNVSEKVRSRCSASRPTSRWRQYCETLCIMSNFICWISHLVQPWPTSRWGQCWCQYCYILRITYGVAGIRDHIHCKPGLQCLNMHAHTWAVYDVLHLLQTPFLPYVLFVMVFSNYRKIMVNCSSCVLYVKCQSMCYMHACSAECRLHAYRLSKVCCARLKAQQHTCWVHAGSAK